MRTIMACLALCAAVAEAAAGLDLVADPHFERGLRVKDRSGAEQVIWWKAGDAAPVWLAGQHYSKSCFADASYYVLTANGFSFKDDYESLTINPPDGEADFIAGVNAKNEYGGVYRKKGDPWPHLYLSQRISNPGGHLGDRSPRISEMARLDFECNVRLLYDRKNQGEGFSPKLHAAQFCFLLTVQNLERKSPGYGDYYWFGISLYDSRWDVTRPFVMQDISSAKKKGTEKLIYDIGIQPFTQEVVGAGKWVTVRGDLLPHIVAGLEEGWKRGFLPGSKDLVDYGIGSLVIGWEVTGLNDAAMAVRGLRAAAVLKSETSPSTSPGKGSPMKWIEFPDPRLDLRGLPWFRENAPELWRLPRRAQHQVPAAVWGKSLAPDGGRIRFACNTSQLRIRVQGPPASSGQSLIDAYVNGECAGSAGIGGTEGTEVSLFEEKDRTPKNIDIYLPSQHEIRLLAVGVDEDAEMKAPAPFALSRPLVCYGSSVLQGAGAKHPAMTYPAILARRLNLDFVNLGFGGAGKAEPEVVALVGELDACCFLFDLGKSYGAQPMEPYGRMLDAIRASHRETPIVCVTPIYSLKEAEEAAYHEKSEGLRRLMRDAAGERIEAGDKHIFVVEGLSLFGEADKDVFSDPLHPTDAGYERIAERLAPTIKKILFGKTEGE